MKKERPSRGVEEPAGPAAASSNEILHIASRCGSLCGLGYLGADLVLDRHRGPMLLELNARPGLGIQLANRAPLLPRLRLIEKTPGLTHFTPAEKIRFTKDQFGG